MDTLKRGFGSRRRTFWALTTWAGASILAGFALGLLGFTRLGAASRTVSSELGLTILYIFLGTQVIIVGVVFYMYSLMEAQKIEPTVDRALNAFVQKLPPEDPRRQNLPVGSNTRWRHLTPVVVIGQGLAILALLGWLSTEYQSNLYMQNWVRSNLPGLRVLLDPYFVALLTGIFVGGILIYFLQKRSREQRILEYLRRIE